jgi:hypothetical protein
MKRQRLTPEGAVWLLLVSMLRLVWWATAAWRWLRRRRQATDRTAGSAGARQ